MLLGVGEGLTFPGQLWHAGVALRGGTRYVLVGFGRDLKARAAAGTAAGVYDAAPGAAAAAGALPFTVGEGSAAPRLLTLAPAVGLSGKSSPRHELAAEVRWEGCPTAAFGLGQQSTFHDEADASDVGVVWLVPPPVRDESAVGCQRPGPQAASLALPLPAGFVAAHGTLLFAFPPNHTFAAIPLQAEPSCARPGGSCGDAAGIAHEFAAALSG